MVFIFRKYILSDWKVIKKIIREVFRIYVFDRVEGVKKQCGEEFAYMIIGKYIWIDLREGGDIGEDFENEIEYIGWKKWEVGIYCRYLYKLKEFW